MMEIDGKDAGTEEVASAISQPQSMSLGRAVTLAVVAAFVALSMVVHANGAWQGSGGQAQAYLPPEPSCKDFVAAETIVWSANRYWLSGYLSAYNMLSNGSGNVGGNADYETMVQWLVDRCSNEPTLSFLDAVTALIRALEQRGP